MEWSIELYSPSVLICRLSCSPGDAIINILFTTSCQFICLPTLHNILENSYRNWEIWVYKTESICCAFSLYYILYFISFIFFFIYFLSNIWTVIYLICSLQEYWIYYQNNKKMTKTFFSKNSRYRNIMECLKLILKCHITWDILQCSKYSFKDNLVYIFIIYIHVKIINILIKVPPNYTQFLFTSSNKTASDLEVYWCQWFQ